MVTETKLAYRPADAARVIGVSKDTVERLIVRGELKSLKIGSARLITAAEIEAFLARKLEESA